MAAEHLPAGKGPGEFLNDYDLEAYWQRVFDALPPGDPQRERGSPNSQTVAWHLRLARRARALATVAELDAQVDVVDEEDKP
jgi:hypothetical protein